jgi:hypothetical protein
MSSIEIRKLIGRLLVLIALAVGLAMVPALPSEVNASRAPCCSACDACLDCCDANPGASCCGRCASICAHCNPGC